MDIQKYPNFWNECFKFIYLFIYWTCVEMAKVLRLMYKNPVCK
jgi:hypothetical protein